MVFFIYISRFICSRKNQTTHQKSKVHLFIKKTVTNLVILLVVTPVVGIRMLPPILDWPSFWDSTVLLLLENEILLSSLWFWITLTFLMIIWIFTINRIRTDIWMFVSHVWINWNCCILRSMGTEFFQHVIKNSSLQNRVLRISSREHYKISYPNSRESI